MKVVVDDAQGMQMTNTTLDALEKKILIKRCAVFHSLIEGHFVFRKTDARNPTVAHDATSVFDNIGMWMPPQKLICFNFVQDKVAKTHFFNSLGTLLIKNK
ncbi:hypothetical protein E4U09_004584, partial [Claviceps aff. purpurea]